MTRRNSAPDGDAADDGAAPVRYEVHHSASDVELGNTVARTVAAVTGVDPRSLRPLYEVVDPDALARLFGSEGGTRADSTGRITFSYERCTVSVHADGRVVVTAPDEDAE